MPTPQDILAKLSKRSTPASKASNIWLAQGYSLADLYRDIAAMALAGAK